MLSTNTNVTPRKEMPAVVKIKVKAISRESRSKREFCVRCPMVSVAAPIKEDPTMKVAKSAWPKAAAAMANRP